jgi:hypothetical protein
MIEELITFETAKLAKEKGFDINELKVYINHQIHGIIITNRDCIHNKKDILCNAPTQSLLQKWLREEHNLNVSIDHGGSSNWYFIIDSIVLSEESKYYIENDDVFDTYEQALEIGLQEALKLI